MNSEYFVFPSKFDDLKVKVGTSGLKNYLVNDENFPLTDQVTKISRGLHTIESKIFGSWDAILSHENFDYIYLTINYLSHKISDSPKDVPIELHVSLVDTLIGVYEKLKKKVEFIKKESIKEDPKNVGELRNALKMVVFLICFYLDVTCIKESKGSIKDELANTNSTTDKENKGKKAGKKNKKDNADYKEKLLEKHLLCLTSLESLYNLKLNYLWYNGDIEPDFMHAILNCNLKMLESKSFMAKEQSKKIVFLIIEHNIEDSISSKDISEKLRHRIYEDENLTDTICDFLIRSYKSEITSMIQLTCDTVSNLCETLMEKTNYNTESQAVKNAKEILTKLGNRIPKLFHNMFSSIIKLYASDAYLIRNGLSDIITQIILQILKDNTEIDTESRESHLKARIKMIEILSSRILDKNAFCRSHTLGCLAEICQDNSLPREMILELFEKAFGRIKDQSALVRKKAIQLIYELIKLYVAVKDETALDIKNNCLSREIIQRDLKIINKEVQDKNLNIEELKSKLQKFSEETDEFKEMYDEYTKLKERVITLEQMKEFVNNSWRIVDLILNAIPDLTQLLFSKNISDVTESIRTFLLLKKLNIPEADVGMKKMLGLIWSKDEQVKDGVLTTYFEVYFNPNVFTIDQIANNLLNIVINSNLTDLTSFEKIIKELVLHELVLDEKALKDKKIKAPVVLDKKVFAKLWEIFKNVQESCSSNIEQIERCRAALLILRVAALKDQKIIHGHFQEFIMLLKEYLQNDQDPDWIIIKEIACIMGIFQVKTSETVETILQLLCYNVIKFHGTLNNEWLCATEEFIKTVFVLKKNPEKIMYYMIHKMCRFLHSWQSSVHNSMSDEPGFVTPSPMQQHYRETVLTQKTETPNFYLSQNLLNSPSHNISNKKQSDEDFENKLAQLIFVLGQAAIKILVHVDALENFLQKQKIDEEKKKQIAQVENANKEDELDKIHGGLDAEFERKRESLHKILEENVVSSEENLLGVFLPLIKSICLRTFKRGYTVNPVLERAAALTLSKYMCVSSQLCSEENLYIIFSLLGAKVDPVIKTNIIIAMGDLIQRYPNIIEQYTPNLYKNLHDFDASVRKTTLMVLTHLILNDMLKIKGEICDIAILLDDADPKIQNFVKIFFHELNKKDSKIIYNLLPEAISKMSKQNTSDIIFQNFARNMMQYLERERYSESLVDKLCLRFKNSEDIIELKNTSFCLTLLAYNERATKKLIEHFENYRDRLKDVTIYENFQIILGKIRKSMGKIDKKEIDDLEMKITNFSETHIERIKKDQKPQKRAPGVRGQKSKTIEEEKKVEIDSEHPPANPRKVIAIKKSKEIISSAAPQRTLRARAPSNKMIIELDSDDNDSREMILESDNESEF